MGNHEYIINDFYGRNIIGVKCHVYQLVDRGKVIYTLNNVILEDGTEKQEPVDLFYARAEAIMDGRAQEGNSLA